MKIRPAIIADMTVIASLQLASIKEQFPQHTEEFLRRRYDEFDGLDSYIRSFIATNSGLCFVAEEKDQVLGIILGLLSSNRHVHIKHFFTRKSERSRGLGSQMMQRFFEGIEQGMRVTLLVAQSNERSTGFYKDKGFSIIDEKDGPFAKMHVMEKKVA